MKKMSYHNKFCEETKTIHSHSNLRKMDALRKLLLP